MKFAVNENTIMQCDLVDFLRVCKRAGFSAVEISYAKLKDALRFLPPVAIVEELLPMRVLSVNAFEDVFLTPEDSWATVEAEALLIGELCRSISCPAVVLPSNRWYDTYGPCPSRVEITRLYRSRLTRMKELFAPFNVTVMFEPIDFPEFIVGTVGWTNEILNTPELSDLPVVPDIHNMHRNGEGSSQLQNLKNPIGIFHIDDTMPGAVETLDVAKSRMFPGEGVAQADAWIKTVTAMGYDGYYSLELFDDQIYRMDPQQAANLCMEKLTTFEKSW